jgi:hypothetical protein
MRLDPIEPIIELDLDPVDMGASLKQDIARNLHGLVHEELNVGPMRDRGCGAYVTIIAEGS